jgi:hypothetical protein
MTVVPPAREVAAAGAAVDASSAAFVAAAERRARSIAYAMNATAYTAMAEYTL